MCSTIPTIFGVLACMAAVDLSALKGHPVSQHESSSVLVDSSTTVPLSDSVTF
jgi:hypothetical protein